MRLLLSHPEAEVTAISSVSFEGKAISEVYPAYFNLCDMVCETAGQVVDKCDVVFAALPHGLSQELAKACDEKGKAFIDLGADFRLDSEEEYQNGTAEPIRTRSSMKRRFTACRSCSVRIFSEKGSLPIRAAIRLGLRWLWRRR